MLLAVDTSTAQMGLAIHGGAQILSEYAWRSSQRHTVELAPAIADLLSRCGLTMDAILAVGVAIGPGSFTSLRVGLSLAKGLALARHIPLIGISTLDVLAAAQPAARYPLAAAIQAGRGRFAVGWYKSSRNGWRATGPARVMTVEELIREIDGPAAVCGEFSAEDREKLVGDGIHLASPAHSVRRPAILAELAQARWKKGEVDDEASLAPIYLHAAESTPS